MERKIAVVTHPQRGADDASVHTVIELLRRSRLDVDVDPDRDSVRDCELILVIGGDGTILKAAELGRPAGIPILGINYGHVGFLSEADPEQADEVVAHIANREWQVDPRMTIDLAVKHPNGMVERNWALNEAAMERDPASRTFEASIGVDGRELSSFKVDTVLFATATGSTAYSFSGGGPVVWPDVEAMVLTPVAAHALFTRPLVVGPASTLELRVAGGHARVRCDGRRDMVAPLGSTITAVKGERPVLLARLNDVPFSGRLVSKFRLPVNGWRESLGQEQSR
ncbi:MAG: NAD kinase [Actinomycetaceae bacterium]|nr:NAD kinase [Actinomycetaceae bacterium]